MLQKPFKKLLVVGLILGGFIMAWYVGIKQAMANDDPIKASGTIESIEVTISSISGGRVVEVLRTEGDAVKAGDLLVQFDTETLERQREYALAGLATARGNESAAQAMLEGADASYQVALANYNLLESGASFEEIAVAQTAVDKARLAAEIAREAYEDLPPAARETEQGKSLKGQMDLALVGLEHAQAQLQLVRAGPREEVIEAGWSQVLVAKAQKNTAQAQVEISRAQVDAAQAQVSLLDVQIKNLSLKAPSDGVITSRRIQPGELAVQGMPLLHISQLHDLKITVFVPEDLYGLIKLGDVAKFTVHSYPGETFQATVMKIADKAEFTPRNVQTAEGRKTMVFAIKLSLDDPNGKLKPGMPADVEFSRQYSSDG